MNQFYLISSIAFFLFSTHSSAQQDTIKTGGYRNSIEFINTTPSFESRFILTKRKNRKIPELYEVKYCVPTLYTEIINKSIWGIYDGNYFYLNAKRLGMAYGYIRIEKLGKYAYFRGKPIRTISQKERLKMAFFNYGLTGVAITSTRVDKENKDNIHYILNFETGMINLLTKENIIRILEPYQELLLNFQHEENNKSLEMFLKYIDLINQANNPH